MTPSEPDYYSLAEVLTVADIHPFYNPQIQYPPSAEAISAARTTAKANQNAQAHHQIKPLLQKSSLYATIQRLIADTSPLNTYRQSIYVSVTGGGSGRSAPLFFGTDAYENRRQRALFGKFLAATGVITPGVDWVVTMHTAAGSGLYRSLDLTLELFENAGASCLAVGHAVPPEKVIQTVLDYHANVLTGDGSQIVALVYYISRMEEGERKRVTEVVDKVIYTSERLTKQQRDFIRSVMGERVSICSVMGSAEAGPFAVYNPALTDGMEVDAVDGDRGFVDFVYDTRAVLFEILPAGPGVPDKEDCRGLLNPLSDSEVGIIVQTSLARLRNPLVRYVTGDIGSVHPLPEQARALVPEGDWPFLRVLRHRGRDGRFSFEWGGEYIELDSLSALIDDAELGVLQWQVILDKKEGRTVEALLEVRALLRGDANNCETAVSGSVRSRETLLTERIRHFFNVNVGNEDLFRLRVVDSLDGFERSVTGNKVIKFLDRFNN